MIGTMIEIPRACLTADKIAETAQFFSFGTNDLTQMTLGMSRDDAGRFLPDYVDERKAGIFKDDPFQSLDQAGVGMLVKMGIEKGRSTRKKVPPIALIAWNPQRHSVPGRCVERKGKESDCPCREPGNEHDSVQPRRA